MIRGRALDLWAALAGLALWCPALAIPGLALPMQILDILAPMGALLALRSLIHLPPLLFVVLLSAVFSILLSWSINGGHAITLTWSLCFALPFVAGMALVAADPSARKAFVAGFLAGAILSAGLFLAQITLGAEELDFRTNYAFRLPPQYGRAFALLPEVSSYAVHAIIALCVAIGLILHRKTGQRLRILATFLAGALLVTLFLSRSTGVLVLFPPLFALAMLIATRASANAVILMAFGTALLGAVLILYVDGAYVERLSSASAERSSAMRLASILGGLSVLQSGEMMGVGIGRNDEVAHRAFEVARAMGLSFGTLPEGVNSQIVGRIFEEGWPAVVHFSLAAAVLVGAVKRWSDPFMIAFAVIAVGSALSAAGILGYRGLYTAWIWLAVPAGLLKIDPPVRGMKRHVQRYAA